MERPPIVSDLVRFVLEASSSAIAKHFALAFAGSRDFDSVRRKCLSFDNGNLDDLDDSESIGRGFDHEKISEIFRRFPYRDTSAPGVNRHIWGADEDHQLRTLVRTGVGKKRERSQDPEGSTEDSKKPRIDSRTRVSALVQQALLRSRRVVQFEKASTAIKDNDESHVFTPSPFYIAKQILSNPFSPSSEAYATAALNIELLRLLALRFGPITLNHQTVQRALELIWNRASTSKPIRYGADPKGEALYLCHHLAMKGVLSLQVEWERQAPANRPDKLFESIDNFFQLKPGKGQKTRGHPISFRLHPGFAETPDAGELLNELQGLPLPIEGASTIFHQGVRFGSNGEIIAALSGPAGVGKTSACLSIAAALAPLGCRTLFLSCEEAADDLTTRLDEAVADSIRTSSPPFKCVSFEQFRTGSEASMWFQAHSVRVNPEEGEVDAAFEIRSLIETTLQNSEFFSVFRQSEGSIIPYFARPIIIVDGFHQLFLETDEKDADVERSLRQLIDLCRRYKAIFIFTMASNGKQIERLDYLCDLVMEFDRRGIQSPDEFTTRIVKLLKVRRQPALVGAHIFHLTGAKRFRIKPNVAASAEKSKSLRWVEPDASSRIMLYDGPTALSVRSRAQILLYGKGSSGKAGLGLYILHRRALSNKQISSYYLNKSELPFHESRTLVVSFLYQTNYFKTLGKKLPTVTSQSDRSGVLPNRAFVDVISLYPGGLTPEDLLAKVENQLLAAELSGIPYTGVLIDGIHNVFVQFPLLEQDATVWPQLFNLLRRRGITVVTTHTEFELHAHSLSVDFEHAQRKSAPLLSVIVSGADYVFELSGRTATDGSTQYQISIKGMLGEDPPLAGFEWDRQRLRIRGPMIEVDDQLQLPLGAET